MIFVRIKSEIFIGLDLGLNPKESVPRETHSPLERQYNASEEITFERKMIRKYGN